MKCSRAFTKSFISLFIIALLALPALGGDWVSLGGELFRFARNPWFVKNTTQVTYCVTVDQGSISAKESEVRALILESIAYWKDQFGRVQSGGSGGMKSLEVATQDFVEKSCSGSVDLRFAIGYGSLTKEEIDYLKDPRKYVGVTVRTDYDQVKLKGKGFIYISSDIGPFAYHNPGHLTEKAWQHPLIMKYALIHELGHVFGIPHTGTGLMSETFLDQLLLKKFTSIYLRYPLESYLYPASEITICDGTGSFDRDFFQVPTSEKCIRFRAKKQRTAWDVFKLKDASASEELIGEVIGTSPTAEVLGGQPAVFLHLPDEQAVFSGAERFFGNFITGAPIVNTGYNGFYRTKESREPRHIFMHLSPTAVTMVGTSKGRTAPVMVYSPPTLLQKMSPIPL
jgi:hypothetical protein